MEEILVSIICNAYNHEPYIRDALDGFVMQKTDFPFEVLVHDDASTDKTAEIIRQYEEKYPDIIKPVYQTENQYSKKVSIGKTFQFPRAKGKYFAFCEGDDYWTDPLKLQKQVDALEKNPQADICAHTAQVVAAATKQPLHYLQPRQEDCLIPVEDVIYGEGGFVSTNSLVCRKEIVLTTPRFREDFQYDYTLQIAGALRGGMIYLNDNMSAYRSQAVGSWTTRMYQDTAAYDNFFRRKQQMLQTLNEETGFRYDQTIQRRLDNNELQWFLIRGRWGQALEKKYRPYLRSLGRAEVVKTYIKWLMNYKPKRKK